MPKINEKEAAANYIKYKNDPWAFLTECVYTIDQVDRRNPIKLFPKREYAKMVCHAWMLNDLIATPKSRRMTMSWEIIGLYVWDTIFNQGRMQAFVSKKEDDANELVLRAKHIVDHIPEDKIHPDLIPKYRSKFCLLEFPDINSKIMGFPQGADQLRQFTFSGIFGDESAFWEQAEEFYAASFPTIDGGGRMTLVSSPAPGFFKRLCYDALSARGDITVAEYAPDIKEPMTGVQIWRNKKNKFLVMRLHYTADPQKRSPEYKESIKDSMPLMQYLREYELSWDTFAGYPVFPEFNKELHVVSENVEPKIGLPIIRGWDFGLAGACVIGQYQEGVLYILREYITINKNTAELRDMVLTDMAMRYPEWHDQKEDFLDYGDPSGHFVRSVVSDKDMNTHARVLGEKGIVMRPGPVNWEERKHGVLDYLTGIGSHGPKLKIVGNNCPLLIKGFEGGYRFDDRAAEKEPNKVRPIKDQYSHPHDALQYLCCGVKQTVNRMKKSIPVPAYSITKKRDTRYG